MYKIKFQEHTLFISDDVCSFHIQSIQKNRAVVYQYTSKKKLEKILEELQTYKIKNHILYTEDIEDTMSSIQSIYTNVEAAGGLVVNNNKEILFINRNNKWDLPKGKIEKNETTEYAAVREVEEETGIKVVSIDSKLITTYHTYVLGGKNILKANHWFLMNAETNQRFAPQLEENISYVGWKSVDEIPKLMENSYESIADVLDTYLSKL